MSEFTDALWLEPLGVVNRRHRWQVVKSIHWEIGAKDSGWLYEVPAGFQTDLATIPRCLWIWWDGSDPRYAQPATLHDHLCLNPAFDRPTTDAQFLAALQSKGVGPVEARVLYWAVCSFRFWKTILRK